MPTNIQNLASEVSGKAIVPVVQTTAQVGVVNNFNLTRGYTILRCTAVSLLLEITGFQVNGATPQDGDRVVVEAVGGGPVRIASEDTGSLVTNRAVSPSVRGQIIGLNGAATYVYDSTSSRWHLVEVQPGEPIAVPFNASNFTGSGTMTWTVEALDQDVWTYQQRGKVLWQQINIRNTDVGGSADIVLIAPFPNSFTTSLVAGLRINALAIRNANAREIGVVIVNSTTTFGFVRSAQGLWTLTTADNTDTEGVFELEID